MHGTSFLNTWEKVFLYTHIYETLYRFGLWLRLSRQLGCIIYWYLLWNVTVNDADITNTCTRHNQHVAPCSRYPESLLSLSTLTTAHQSCPDTHTAHTCGQDFQTLTNRWCKCQGWWSDKSEQEVNLSVTIKDMSDNVWHMSRFYGVLCSEWCWWLLWITFCEYSMFIGTP